MAGVAQKFTVIVYQIEPMPERPTMEAIAAALADHGFDASVEFKDVVTATTTARMR